MIIARGLRHRGEPTELVVLSDPYFVKLLLDYRNPEGDMPDVRQDFLRLIDLFDRKKFVRHCRSCNEPAKLLAFYKSTLFHEPWCGQCIPNWMIVNEFRWDTLNDYISALDYVDDFCHSERIFYRMIIRNIAMAKGLPDRLGIEEAMEFFRPDSAPNETIHAPEWV